MILAPAANGNRLSLTQCKFAWVNMISDFHVKIFETHCTLQSIASNEMAWKAHWAWHLGTSGANTSSSGDGGTSAIERKLQSLSDRIACQAKGGGRGNGRGGGRRGGKHFQPGNGNGGKK